MPLRACESRRRPFAWATLAGTLGLLALAATILYGVGWQVNTPTQDEVEDMLERYAELAQNPVVVH